MRREPEMDLGVLRRDGRTDPFFDGAAAGRLVVRRCDACDRWLAPDAGDCPGCGGSDLAWAEASGEAALVSWTVLHGRPADDGAVPPPVCLALVELAEGPWLHTRLVGADPAGLREGLPLRAVFEHPAEGESYVLFRPAAP
ncbi:Zn-ribbon domain-containing OB-fold protein [Actinomadura keratinilytica]